MSPTEIIYGEDRPRARRFIALAILSLLIGGVLSLMLVLGRTPGIDRLVGDPLFFKRALVVHVVLALVVWFHAFITGLCALLPGRRFGPAAVIAPTISALGVAALLLAPLAKGAQPILSNYVPVVDHPLFLAGLALFAIGVLCSLFDGRLFPPPSEARSLLPPSARVGLRAAGLLLCVAAATFAVSLQATPAFLEPAAYYENLFWGGGHVLQFASVAAMLAIWLFLVERASGREVISPRLAAVLFGLLTLPALLGLLLPFQGTVSATYRDGFTQLMRWGIFPPVGVVMALSLRAILSGPPGLRSDGRTLSFFASAGLTILGFVLGALIRGSNTMVPAHYHASIGAVSVALMAATYALFEPLGLKALEGRAAKLARLQPMLFGAGQSVFALGFALAGAHGMGRKAYGAEQVHRSLAETFGLGVMALGGLVAVAGGLLFLGLVLRAWAGRDRPVHSLGDTAWTRLKASLTPSRS